MLLRTIILSLVVATPVTAFPQVESLTLGINVNSPYGLSEPWFTIRNALLRCDDLQTVDEHADRRSETARVTPKGGQLPDFDRLQKIIGASGAGATLRSIEATVAGTLVKVKDKWGLRVVSVDIPLRPLTILVQHEQKKPRPATAEELKAYENLLSGGATEVRVTGPLRFEPALALEVRTFVLRKTK